MTKSGQKRPLIYARRTGLKLTQEEMATRLGIHRVTLAKIETLRYLPTGAALEAIAAELGVSPDVVTDDLKRLMRGRK